MARSSRLLFALPLLFPTPASAQALFTLQPVGPGLHSQTFPNDLNDTPMVAGSSATHIVNPSAVSAFVWQNASITNLPAPPGFQFSSAAAINANGVAVGYVADPFVGTYVASQWTNGVYGALQTPAGVTRSFAHDIDANGTVAGHVVISAQDQPCTWISGAFNQLGLPGGALGGSVNVLLANGTILGSANFGSGIQHVCAWQANGVVTDLTPTSTLNLAAAGMLANGDVAATAFDVNTGNRTPVLISGGVVQTLPMLAGGRGWCADANASGWIVGACTTATQQSVAVLYVGGTLFDLNSLVVGTNGWNLSEATGISDQGRICGFGTFNGQPRGFVLTPLPCGASSYCTPGTSSNGCTAVMSASGTPSVSSSAGFVVTTSGVRSNSQGLIFYGVDGAHSSPWGTGTSLLCVKTPVQRTTLSNSGGTIGACDGSFTLDFTAYLATHPNSLGAPFVGGDEVWMQTWYRDPPAPKSTSLSNALKVTLCP